MTAKYRELPDGTRIYKGGMRYKPVPPEKRKYRKWPEGTIWIGSESYLPLPLLEDSQRGSIPFTRPDSEGIAHQLGCRCLVCRVPRVKRKKRERILAEAKAARSG